MISSNSSDIFVVCDKVSYYNKTEARHAIYGLAIKQGEHFHQYKCRECGEIHLTTARNKRIRDINRIGGKKWFYLGWLLSRRGKNRRKKNSVS